MGYAHIPPGRRRELIDGSKLLGFAFAFAPKMIVASCSSPGSTRSSSSAEAKAREDRGLAAPNPKVSYLVDPDGICFCTRSCPLVPATHTASFWLGHVMDNDTARQALDDGSCNSLQGRRASPGRCREAQHRHGTLGQDSDLLGVKIT